MFLLSAITWYLLGLAMPERMPHKRIALCLLNSLAVFLCISANNRPEWSPLRIFFIILALYGLNLTTIYTSKLITVFTSPAYEEQIDTIEEIIESGLPIGMYLHSPLHNTSFRRLSAFAFSARLQVVAKNITIGSRTTIPKIGFSSIYTIHLRYFGRRLRICTMWGTANGWCCSIGYSCWANRWIAYSRCPVTCCWIHWKWLPNAVSRYSNRSVESSRTWSTPASLTNCTRTFCTTSPFWRTFAIEPKYPIRCKSC